MKGHEDVLAVLAEALANELTAADQYLLHGKQCEDWGFIALATKFQAAAVEERDHAGLLIDRMLFLEGKPDLERRHPLRTGATVKELFEADHLIELAAIAVLESGVTRCRAAGDNATEDLLVKILVSEQEDTHWIEAQLNLMRLIGEPNYLAQQLR